MPDSASLTLDVPQEVLDGFESLAEQTARAVSEFAEEALAGYLALQQRQMAAINH